MENKIGKQEAEEFYKNNIEHLPKKRRKKLNKVKNVFGYFQIDNTKKYKHWNTW